MCPARASPIATKRSVPIRIFVTYASAPDFRAAWTKSGSACAVKNTIFDEEPDSLSRLAASIASSFAIEMSVTITSGCSFPAVSTRDSPSSTHPRTSKAGSKRPRVNSKSFRWSSARSIRIFRTRPTAEHGVPRKNPRFHGELFRSEAKAKLPADLARRAHLRVGRRWSAEYWQKRQGLWPTDKVALDAELSEFDTNHQLRHWEHAYNCVRPHPSLAYLTSLEFEHTSFFPPKRVFLLKI